MRAAGFRVLSESGEPFDGNELKFSRGSKQAAHRVRTGSARVVLVSDGSFVDQVGLAPRLVTRYDGRKMPRRS
jgi:hypothetical protein